MKILHINTHDGGGGAAQFAFDFLSDSSWKAHLVVKKKSSDSVQVTQFPTNSIDKLFLLGDKFLWKFGVRKAIKQIFNINEEFNFTFRKLKQLNAYREADIVQLHNIHGGYFDLDALEKMASEKPIIWSMHDMWPMTGGEAHTFDNLNYRKGIAKTTYDHIYPLCSPWVERRQHYLKKKKNIFRKIAGKITFIPGSSWLADCLKNSYVFNKDMKIQVIHESIDTSIFNNCYLRNWKVPRILIINIYSPFKGTEIFNKIFSEFMGIFDLYVLGPSLNIKTFAREIKYFDNTYIADKKKLSGVFNGVDILLFPSKAENFPLATLSAMSCGVCVLGNSVGGLTEQLDDNNGFLFNYDDLNSIISLLKMTTSNIEMTREIGNKASQSVYKKFDSKEMYKKYHSLYKSLIF